MRLISRTASRPIWGGSQILRKLKHGPEKTFSRYPDWPFCHLQLSAPLPPPKGCPEVLTTLGDHILKARLLRGLMQIEAARELGVSGETLHNWETGKRAPQKYLRERIMAFLGYDPREHGIAFPERGKQTV